MNNFDLILDNCLKEMSSGASSLDECLARHPEHAAQLKPLLQTALKIERGHAIRPSPEFKARARTQLYAHMQAHPQPRRRVWELPPAWRVAVSLAALVAAFFITGTAFAQSALPGESLYPWKLSSERAWRAVAPDKVAVDLSLADRRVSELTTIASDAARKAEALDGYNEVLARLSSERGAQNDERILPALKANQEKLSKAGVSAPELDRTITPSNSKPIVTPVVPAPSPLPKIVPSLLPAIVPTVQIPVLNP